MINEDILHLLLIQKIVKLLDPRIQTYLIMIQRDYAKLNIPPRVIKHKSTKADFSITLSTLGFILSDFANLINEKYLILNCIFKL